MIRITTFLLVVFFTSCGLSTAYAIEPSKDLSNTWDSNLRWSIDLSSRLVDKEYSDSFSTNVIGLDIHKVFSTETGDIGTFVFQPYVVNFSNSKKAPYYFDGNSTELTWRIANFNYTALSKGQFNVRLGHFEIPFGLEQNIDTNGTLRQYTYSDRGIKADWGLSINGILPRFDYEFSITRGSGNDITSRDSPYVVAGRVGTPSINNVIAGLSYFEGEVLNSNNSVKRRKLGVDLSWYRYNWEYLFELSAGKDEDISTVNALAEVSWRNRTETLHTYVQFREFQTKLDNFSDRGSEVTIGLNWSVPNNFLISGEWKKPLATLENTNDVGTLLLQIRTRI